MNDKNNRGFRVPMTEDELLRGLDQTTIPLRRVGSEFEGTTSVIASQIVDMMNNTYRIQECDHTFMYPVRNEKGHICDFDLYLYFNTKGGTNIKRAGSKGQRTNTNGNGGVDLRDFLGGKSSTGGFVLNDTFKTVIGSIAILDDDDRIVVEAEKDNPNSAVVKCDFFKVVALVLGIEHDDPYDFNIISCSPINNGGREALDYNLSIIKRISMNQNRRGRQGFDYSSSDLRRMRAANSRR